MYIYLYIWLWVEQTYNCNDVIDWQDIISIICIKEISFVIEKICVKSVFIWQEIEISAKGHHETTFI